jgi:hypothetical protein
MHEFNLRRTHVWVLTLPFDEVSSWYLDVSMDRRKSLRVLVGCSRSFNNWQEGYTWLEI